MKALWSILLFATLVLLPKTAAAQSEGDKTTARNLFFEARDALESKDYARAAELFERSNQLYPAPTAELGMARSLAKAGKLVRAFETYNALSNRHLERTASTPFKQAVADAKKERSALEPRLPALVIVVRGPAAPDVALDGEPLAAAALGVKRFVDPGEHAVQARGEGFEPQKQSVVVTEGEAREVHFDLKALPSPSPSPPRAVAPTAPPPPPEAPAGMSTTRVAGLVVGGIGIVSLAVAGVSGAMYLSKKSIVDGDCHESQPGGTFACDTPSGPEAASAGRTLGWLNAVTLVGGVVAAGVGVTLFVMGGDHRSAVVRTGIGTLSAEARF